MTSDVTVHYLEMTSPGELRPASVPAGEVRLVQSCLPLPELNRFLYVAVGRDWWWIDRLGWSRERWLAWLDRPELETWVLYVDGTPAGYFELEWQGNDVEVAYFGLLPTFVGRGLGGHLLTAAVRRGWQRGAARVWLHTCSLDHAAALPNYLARGFRLVRSETQSKDLTLPAPRPWYG